MTKTSRARVLVVDDQEGTLSKALADVLARHSVETARDAVDAIYKIDTAGSGFDLIFCDLARGDLPGPELWSYLSITRKSAAARMVFIATGTLSQAAQQFLAEVPNVYVRLPLAAADIDVLALRHASWSAAASHVQ